MPSWKKIIVSGSDAQLSNVNIGGADSQYDSGLFDSFTAQTTVASAVQNINDVLAGLAPQQAPELTEVSRISGTAGSTAYIGFDDSTTITGYTGVQASASAIGATQVAAFNQFSTDGSLRLGVVGTTMNGVKIQLNPNVSANTGTYTNYNQYAFKSPADPTTTPETYSIWLNGSKLNDYVVSSATATLSATASGNPATPIGTFTLSSAKSAQFTTSGNTLTLFKHRSGSFSFGSSVSLWRNGYNYLTISQSYGGTLYDTNYIDWVYDPNSTACTVNLFTTRSTTEGGDDTTIYTGTKWMSGIKYYTGISFKPTASISNWYANSYTLPNATFTYAYTPYVYTGTTTPTSQTSTVAVSNTSNTASRAELVGTTITMPSSVRLLGQGVTLAGSLTHFKSSKTPSLSTITMPKPMYDPISTANTALVENFCLENYRYNNITYVTQAAAGAATARDSGSYDSTQLIVTNGALRRPSYLITTLSLGSGLSTVSPVQSSTLSNTSTTNQVYIRRFQLPLGTYAGLSVTIEGFGINLLTAGQSNSINVYLHVPDMTNDTLGYDTSYVQAVNGITIDSSFPLTSTSTNPALFKFNFSAGRISSDGSTSGYVFLKLESTNQAWAGYINKITVA